MQMLSGHFSSERCQELANPKTLETELAVFILIGILVSYLPQHIRIIVRGTSEGLSPYFILLGTVSQTFALGNVLTLPRSIEDVHCCSEISKMACTTALLGIGQIGVQWICFFLIMLLFLIYFPRRPVQHHHESISDLGDDDDPPRSLLREPSPEDYPIVNPIALLVALISILTLVIVMTISAVLYIWHPNRLLPWANFLGITSSFLACVQYFPQIYHTFIAKHVGSLSIPMMCIQTPGSFVFALSLFLRYGTDGWSSWTLFLLTGCLQGILLAMGSVYAVRDLRAPCHESSSSANEDNDFPPPLHMPRHVPPRRASLLGWYKRWKGVSKQPASNGSRTESNERSPLLTRTRSTPS